MTAKEKRAKAQEMHKKFCNLRVSFRAHWQIYGRMAVEFEREELFTLMGYTSMKAYLKSLPDVCYSTIAEAMAVQKAFPQMKVEELSQYKKENLKIIAKLPERSRFAKTTLEAARTMTAKDLRVAVNTKHKIHLEAKIRVMFDVEASAVTVIDAAIEKKQGEADEGEEISRGAALEFICAEFLQRR